MKAMLLSSRKYTKKSTGEVGSTGCILYVLPDGRADTNQIFGFDAAAFPAGSIVNVEFDPNGFLVSMQSVGFSESFSLVLDELK